MTRTLSILHCDDDELDRELVRQALVEGNTTWTFVYARSEAEFSAALDRGGFDLILSDLIIPGYAGTLALNLARQKCPDVPFVFVSGAAVDAPFVRPTGAADHVPKDRLEQLLPAVERALRLAAEREGPSHEAATLAHVEVESVDAFENAMEGIYWSTPEGRLLRVNHTLARLCGCATGAELRAWLTDSARDLYVEADSRVAFERRLEAGTSILAAESQIRGRDGTTRWISENARAVRSAGGQLLRYESHVTDIAPRKAAEEEYRQQEVQRQQSRTLEAVGQLAGGLAHDYNNVLTVVIGYARLLLDDTALAPAAFEPLTRIFTAGTRAAMLTRELLVYGRMQAIHRTVLAPGDVTRGIADLLRRLAGDSITLQLALAPDAGYVEMDAGMLEELVINLAAHARDAMPHGGTLTIAADGVIIDDSAVRGHPDARSGPFVCLRVTDTGGGISSEHLGRIFEPFNAHQPAVHGGGLGLAMVLAIVQQHNGWIEVQSGPGIGTGFGIFLPAVARRPAEAVRGLPRPAGASLDSATMLVVEDEMVVREFAVAVLKREGYRVLQAPTATAALEVWKWHAARIVLLVTDVVLPDGLGGLELAGRLRQEKSNLKVLLTSGYTSNVMGEEFRAAPGTRFMAKPYRPQALAHAVRDLLAEEGPAPPAGAHGLEHERAPRDGVVSRAGPGRQGAPEATT